MGVRAEMLELAILGELDQPLHGYELRRRLSETIGPLRRLSFGSLYPALHRLTQAGLLTSDEAPTSPGHRKLITYAITPEGRDHLARELERVEVDDDSFAVAMGLMSSASPAARLRLLKARRARVLDRRESRQRTALGTSTARDPWRAARTELEAEQDDSEITWLDRLIDTIPVTPAPSSTPPTPAPAGAPQTDPPGTPSSMPEGTADARAADHRRSGATNRNKPKETP